MFVETTKYFECNMRLLQSCEGQVHPVHVIKACGGSGTIPASIPNLCGDERLAKRPGRFTPAEISPGVNWFRDQDAGKKNREKIKEFRGVLILYADVSEHCSVLVGRCEEFFTPAYEDLHTYLPMKMEQSVPKRRHIKLGRRGITQKKAHNIQNTAKVWNQK
jgi:hypothetical protein